MSNATEIQSLLERTEILVKHQREIDLLKGENFNIFSVLKMESKENNTHSAFLGELLNPKGSHLKGTLFLDLFLEQLNLVDHIDSATAQVKLEMYVGQRNNEAKTGGRIDIYVWDANGKVLSIENKIYAHDQYAQIERYYNHKKEVNKVYYLTLNGSDPGKESKGALTEGTHYFNISYRDNITTWLDDCMKAAVEIPILRESIKQYIILIKKLTNTMATETELELGKLILENYEAAEKISNHFASTKIKITSDLRELVFKGLAKELSAEFNIHRGNKLDHIYSQIWINPKIKGEGSNFVPIIRFGVESFSGMSDFSAKLTVGVFTMNNDLDDLTINDQDLEGNQWWANLQIISPFKGDELEMKNPALLLKIISDDSYRQKLVNHIVKESSDYINKYKSTVFNYLNQ